MTTGAPTAAKSETGSGRKLLFVGVMPSKDFSSLGVIEGPLAAICPGSALQLHPRATVILDENSAAGLQYADHYRWIDQHKFDWQRPK